MEGFLEVFGAFMLIVVAGLAVGGVGWVVDEILRLKRSAAALETDLSDAMERIYKLEFEEKK